MNVVVGQLDIDGRRSGEVDEVVLAVEAPQGLVDGDEVDHEAVVDFVEELLFVFAIGDDLHEVLAVGGRLDRELGPVADDPAVLLLEGRVVGLAEDVRHVGLGVLHSLEGHPDEGEQPHHAEQVAGGGVVLLVLLGRLQVLVVAAVVPGNAEAHFHFDEAEHAGVALEALVVLAEDADLVLNIREGQSQEGVDEFEGFAELVEDLEELLEDHLIGHLILLVQVRSQPNHQLHVEVLVFLLHLSTQQIQRFRINAMNLYSKLARPKLLFTHI